MRYGIIFVLGGLSALGYNSSLLKPKQAVISEGIATHSAVAVSGEESIQVGRAIDGDTIEFIDGRRVRYIGIDTPEIGDGRRTIKCFAKEAKEENARLVEGKTVRLKKDVSETDKYGRLLRYVYIDTVFVNDYLVRQGFANAAIFPPDITHQEQLLEAEREARGQGRGLWKKCFLKGHVSEK